MKVVRFSALSTGRLYRSRKHSWYSFLLETDFTPFLEVLQKITNIGCCPDRVSKRTSLWQKLSLSSFLSCISVITLWIPIKLWFHCALLFPGSKTPYSLLEGDHHLFYRGLVQTGCQSEEWTSCIPQRVPLCFHSWHVQVEFHLLHLHSTWRLLFRQSTIHDCRESCLTWTH
jgi:hypothetical protein